MISVTSKTLQDLEFHTILQTISERCNTDLGKQKALEITPFKDATSLLPVLNQTSEYLASFTNNNAIPNHGFEAITKELQLLNIEDSYLDVASFHKISGMTATAITL